MIDIIIPAYNAHNSIKKTLLSIELQTIKDKLNIYIIDDCSEKDYSDEINLFKDKLNIIQYRFNENSGPGVARQYGIDHSNSEFIMFIDSDDMFYDCFSLENIYKKIILGYDVVNGIMIEEAIDSSVKYDYNQWNLCGKIYRRKFFETYSIRFNSSRLNENNGFNQLVLMCNPRLEFVSRDVYLYRYNFSSIRHNDDYQFYSIESYIYNTMWAINSARLRNCNSFKIAYNLYLSCMYIYYIYLKNFYSDNSLLIIKWSIDLNKMLEKYEYLLDAQTKEKIYKDFVFDGVPEISFREFRNLISLYSSNK